MLDYYLPMLSPNEGCNEIGLTMQSAGPVREPWQPIKLEFQFKGSEFGRDAFAFRHPSLGQTDVYHLLESQAHHLKLSPVGTGGLIAMIGLDNAAAKGAGILQNLDWRSQSRRARPRTRMSYLPPGYTDNVILELSK